MNVLTEKLKEVISAVLPVTLFGLIIQLIFQPLSAEQTWRFVWGAFMIICGLAVFLLGVDFSISPIGLSLGKSLIKTNRLPLVLLGGLGLGFLISIAEPDLLILAGNVERMTAQAIGKLSLIVIVSLGVAVLIAIAFYRLIKQIHLKWIFAFVYLIILLIAIFSPAAYQAIAFDASGATTGAITVPFVLALSVGVASISHRRNRDGSDSFGMVGLASAGAIVAVLILGVFSRGGSLSGNPEAILSGSDGIIRPFLQLLLPIAKESILSVVPIAVIFYATNYLTRDVRKRSLYRVHVGLIYAYLGLVIFLAGVNSGFMEVGMLIGQALAERQQIGLLLITGFLLGLTTILAEPAVHVLTHQIEQETSGYLPRKLVLSFLSVGVAFSGLLAMLRIVVPGMQLWHLLLPGYLVAITMMFFTPQLFIGIAFDSGGVASGPMTATFILSFAQGVANRYPGADVILDGFGVIALVAMTPLISLQVLGLIYQYKVKRAADPEGEKL